MAFTEFTCRAGGSNLNAGTLDGVSEAAVAALVTYANGGWNSATGVFTPAAGNPVAAGVAVGQFASVYVDGSAAPTGFVGRITAVTTTTVTVSLSAKTGTPPTTNATARTLVVGGAWKGPNGADRFPINSANSSLTNVTGNLPRVNLKNDQTYVPTAQWSEGQAFTGAYYEGYTTAFGDGGFAVVDGGTGGASFNLLNVASGTPDIEYRYITFQNNGATGSSALVSGGGPSFYRCRFLNSRGNGFEGNSGNNQAVFVECEGSGCNQSNSVINGAGGAPFGGNSSSGNVLVRCYSHDNTAGANCHGYAAGASGTIVDSIFAGNAGCGINSGGVRVSIRGNVLYGNGSHGISISAGVAHVINDNILVSNGILSGGYGINGTWMKARNNAFYNNTSGQYSTLVTGDKSAITLTGSPFVSTSGLTPFQLNNTAGAGAACRAAGLGTYLVNGVVTALSAADVGALQHADPAQPATSDVRFGVGYAGGTLTGALALPAVNVVLAPTAYGFAGEFVGTLAPGTGPAAATLAVADDGDGTATATVGGSDPAAANAVYFAAVGSGVIPWTLAGTRGGDGAVSLSSPAGSWLFEVRSTLAGLTTVGQEVYAVVRQPGPPGVSDNADGTGVTASLAGFGAVPVVVELRDTAQDNWRDAGGRTGDGIVSIPAGDGAARVLLSRSYWVRVRYPAGSGTGVTAAAYVVPTQGRASTTFALILELQAELIRLDLPEIGGRVVRCIDPNGAGPQIVTHPAAWVYQAEPEGPGAVGDNRTYGIKIPIEVGISDRAAGGMDWVERLEWWLYVRHRLFDHFSRVPDTGFGYPQPAARKWEIRPGQVRADDPKKYEYRYQTLTFLADVDRDITGG